MQDSRRFISDARAAGASVRTIGKDAQRAGHGFSYMGEKAFWANQLFFTMRRVVYGLTLAVAGLGAGAVAMGIQWASTMEQNQIAFQQFLGSTSAANAELSFLFDLAAKTPFELPQLLQATRMFLAFNFTVEETNAIMTNLADAVAGFGLGSEAIERATLALGQMRATGRVLGQEVRQLEQLGLIDPEDFQKRLNLPRDWRSNPGELGIPAEAAIDAITAYWEEKFGGMSEKFVGTWQGRWSNMRDFAGRMFAGMADPLRMKLQNEIFPLVTQIAGEAVPTTGGQFVGWREFFAIVDKNLDKGTNFEMMWVRLSEATRLASDSVLVLARSFVWAFNFMGIGMKLLYPLVAILWVLAKVLQFIEPILGPLIALWIAERTALLLVTAATKYKIFWDIVDSIWTKRRTKWGDALNKIKKWDIFWTKLQTFFTRRNTEATKINYVWVKRDGVMVRNTTAVRKGFVAWTVAASAATWAFTAALIASTVAFLASPVGWVTIAVAGLIVGLTLLYWKFEKLRPVITLLMIPLSPLVFFFMLLHQHIDKVGAALDWLKGKFSGLGDLVPDWLKTGLRFAGNVATSVFGGLTGLQHGGFVTKPGAFTVGERGPERVVLPAGSAVSPISAGDVSGAIRKKLPELVIPLRVELDGRTIAEKVSKYNLDVLAAR